MSLTMSRRRCHLSILPIASILVLGSLSGTAFAQANQPATREQTGPNVNAAVEPELGVWINHTGKGAVQIYRCIQDPSRLCGRIVWLREPTNENGEPLHDGLNPNTDLRSRPICGLPVLGNLQRASTGGWSKGWVYNPEKGETNAAAIRARSETQLALTGYKGIFYKTFVWNRAPNDLPSCGPLDAVSVGEAGR